MEGRSDAILYRNLCRNVEKILSRDAPGATAREINGFLALYDRAEVWDERPSDGLCVFANPGFHVAYRLPGRFPELEVVAPTFHTKPLIRHLQGNALTYYLLALTMGKVVLYEGLGDSIHEVPLRGLAASPSSEEAPGVEGGVAERGGGAAGRGGGGDRMRYGQGGPKDQAKVDLEKFFRAVGKEIWKSHLRCSRKPVILAAPAQHQTLFRKVAQVPTLLEAGVVVDPSRLSPEDLHAEARRVLEPVIERRIAKVREEYGLASSRGQGTDRIGEVATLVVSGRARLLCVESGRRIWGVLSPDTGEIVPGDASKNAYDVDLLDELAEMTLVRGGDVYVLGRDDMPTSTGIAAIARF